MAVVPAQPFSSPAWRATQFAVYVGLWTASAICVRWEGTQARVHANPLVMALAIEFTKLIFSAAMLVYQEGVDGMLAAVQGVPRAVWMKWAVPAALYVVYNRLMFLVLGVYFQPAVYRLLTQQQIVWTAVLCYVILSQRLNKRQICAVALLTVGVCLVYVDELKTWSAGTSMLGPLVASVSQTLCSAFAGVYIEALLRSDQKSSIHLTNLVLYIWTCTLLCLWVWWQRPPGSLISSLYEGSSLASHLAIAFSAMAGIATSTFLRYLGAMWKEFARSAEIITIAVTAHLFLHDTINPNLLWAFPLIVFANLQYNGYLPQWCAFALFKEDEPKEASKDGAV